MNRELLIENIKTKLPHIEPSLLNSIWELVEHAERRNDSPFSAKTPLKFIGDNLTLKEYERLSLKERAALQRGLKEKNHIWLREQFAKRRAAWLVVVSGEVIASGKTLKNLPLAPQHRATFRRTGKFPFVFINDDFMTIEESAWDGHETNRRGHARSEISKRRFGSMKLWPNHS